MNSSQLKRHLGKILVCLIIVTCYSWYQLHRLASKSNNFANIYPKININLNIGDNNNNNNRNQDHVKETDAIKDVPPFHVELPMVTEKTRYPPFIETLIKKTTEAPEELMRLDGLANDLVYLQQNDLVNLTEIRNSSLIFVGGFGRSGTTLMRAILDVHSDIRCGPETKIVMSFLNHFQKYVSTKGVMKDLREAGVKNQTINDAMALFIYHVMANHGQKAVRLCMKDPEVLVHMNYLHKLFPKAKFVYMVRDGRGAAYSFMLRVKEKLTTTKYRSYLSSWNLFNKKVNNQCRDVGQEFCLRIKYEDLVMETNATMREVIKFLNETWEDQLLEHQKFIGSEITVSKIEWSTDQIKKPINKDSLTNWLYKIPYLTEKEIRQSAPMIEFFGYNLTVNATVIQKQKDVAKLNRDDIDRFKDVDRLALKDPRGFLNPEDLMDGSVERNLRRIEKVNFPR